MTMGALVTNLTTDLRTLLSCRVEKYWRLEPPTALTVFVHPNNEAAESDLSIGNDFGTGWEVTLYCETPWDDKAATADAAQAVVDAVRGWANSNREYVPGYVLTCGLAPYTFVTRPAAGKPTYLIALPLRFELPRSG